MRLNGGRAKKCEIKTQTWPGGSGEKHRSVTWLEFCHRCKNQGHCGHETFGELRLYKKKKKTTGVSSRKIELNGS